MARYELRFRESIAKDLRGVPPADVRRILSHLESLREDARPVGSEKLSVQERYRLRQGHYRILYEVNDALGTVEVVKVAHRRDVYRES